jgi:hypothetical protein
MTAENIQFVHELMRSAMFPEILREIVEEEKRRGHDALRAAVSKGDMNAASRFEGQLRAFDDLLGIFARHAKKYRIDTAA